jgi:hypothetical protein
MIKTFTAFFALLFLPSNLFGAESQHIVFSTYSVADDAASTTAGVNPGTATIDNPQAAAVLVKSLIKIPPAAVPQPGDYFIIHLLRWSDDSSPTAPKVAANNWYLYRAKLDGWSQEDFTTNKRIYGAHQVFFYFIHFNISKMGAAPAAYNPSYDFTVTRKTPANLMHLYALLSAFTGGSTASPTAKPAVAAKAAENVYWGGGSIKLQYVPSDILIKSSWASAAVGVQSVKMADDITYDNEGLYHWDVGFAVPVKKISQLKLDSTSGTATPASTSSTDVFAVLDGYIKPIDVKGSGANWIPHPIAGVIFAKSPLSKILVGAALGPHSSELYLGAVFVKQPFLNGSNSCSQPTGTSLSGGAHYCAQFTVGINVPISSLSSKLGTPK